MQIRTFSFDNIPVDLLGTKVVGCVFNGVHIPVNRIWKDLYVSVIKEIYKTHRDIIRGYINKTFSLGSKAIDFADNNHKSFLRFPKPIDTDLFVETNHSSNRIAIKLQSLLDICGLDRKSLSISYYQKNIDYNTNYYNKLGYSNSGYEEIENEETNVIVKDKKSSNTIDTYNSIRESIHTFSFDRIPSDLTSTKVISCQFNETKYTNINSWTTLYVLIVKELYINHSFSLQKLINRNITSGKRIDFADSNTKSLLREGKRIEENLYIETNLKTNDIVSKIYALLEYCKVDKHRFIVSYIKRDEEFIFSKHLNKEENNNNKIATIDNAGIKAKKIPWSEEETALLIETYLNIVFRKIKWNDAVKELSNTLRNLAIKQGKQIDDIFRNCNGINMCLTQIKTLFDGSNGGLSNISSMFIRMVDLYKNDRYSFEKYLNSAKEGLNSNNQFEKDDGIKDYEEADKDSNGSVEENYDDEVNGNDNNENEHDSEGDEAFEVEETKESPKLPTDINRIISFEEYLSLTKSNYCIKDKIYQLSLNYANDVSQIIGFTKYDKISLLYPSLVFASRLILNEDLIMANSRSIVELFEAIGCYVKYLGYLKEIEQNIKERENNFDCYRNISLNSLTQA